MLENSERSLVSRSINRLTLFFWLNTLLYLFMPYLNTQQLPTI